MLPPMIETGTILVFKSIIIKIWFHYTDEDAYFNSEYPTCTLKCRLMGKNVLDGEKYVDL